MNIVTKISAHADDIVGYVVDMSSIEEFFAEFKRWRVFSGASLNKKKTKILNIDEKT